MSNFEIWCDTKGYTLNAGIHVHVISAWANQYAQERVSKLEHSNRAIAETDLRLSAENKRQVARIAELEAALEKSNEAACMGAEIAAAFPVKFPGDWKATPHPLLRKDEPL